jgi:hypothetical protein
LSSASWTMAGRRDWERSSMPMTVAVRPYIKLDEIKRTVIDRLQLGDDVQADVRELVLEHLQEHGEEM